MEISEFSFLGGLLLGLASALHCAGRCGGIATSVTLLFAPKTTGERVRVLAGAQAGKLVSYVAAGAILGAVGSGIYTAFDQTAAFRVLQWIAAMVLIWVGLTLAGFVSMPAFVDRAVARLSQRLNRLFAPLQGSPVGPFVAGLSWGIVPCPMVYAALFTAMLTGSAAGGAIVMAGFGLGTVPSVTLTALGATTLASLDLKGPARLAAGLLIAAFGASTIIPGSPTSSVFCQPPGL